MDYIRASKFITEWNLLETSWKARLVALKGQIEYWERELQCLETLVSEAANVRADSSQTAWGRLQHGSAFEQRYYMHMRLAARALPLLLKIEEQISKLEQMILSDKVVCMEYGLYGFNGRGAHGLGLHVWELHQTLERLISGHMEVCEERFIQEWNTIYREACSIKDQGQWWTSYLWRSSKVLRKFEKHRNTLLIHVNVISKT